MGFMNIFLAMALVGFVAFVFIAETVNPFKPHKLKTLRKRHWVGLVTGLLIALSAFATKIMPTETLLGQAKVSFAAALLLLMPVLLFVVIRTFLRSPKRRGKQRTCDLGLTKSKTAQQAAVSNDATTNTRAPFSTNNVTDVPDPTSGLTLDNQKTAGDREYDELDNTQSSTHSAIGSGLGQTNLRHTDTDNQRQQPSTDGSYTDAPLESDVKNEGLDGYADPFEFMDRPDTKAQRPTAGEFDLTDQAPTPEIDDLAIGGPFPTTAQVFNDAPLAANSDYSVRQAETVDGWSPVSESDVVADDLVDEGIIAWHSEKNPELSEPVASSKSHFDDVNLQLAQAALDEEKGSISPELPIPAYSSAQHSSAMYSAPEHSSIESLEETQSIKTDDGVSHDATTDIKNPDTAEIEQLTAAMDSVTEQADVLQESIVKIQSLTEEEGRYRAQLLNAQVAFENSQRLQIEDQNKRLVSNERQLDEYEIRSQRSASELSQQRQNILTMQERVQDLELELSERQRVFADQVESLKKTKEMARHAALLARKAAMAQQKARTQALKERAARERLEVSAKKAVHIARNAISKLAEEERKNRDVQH